MFGAVVLFVSLIRPSSVLMLSWSRCRRLDGYRGDPSLMLSDLLNAVGLREVVMAWRSREEEDSHGQTLFDPCRVSAGVCEFVLRRRGDWRRLERRRMLAFFWSLLSLRHYLAATTT